MACKQLRSSLEIHTLYRIVMRVVERDIQGALLKERNKALEIRSLIPEIAIDMGKMVHSFTRRYALGSHEGYDGQCLNPVSFSASNYSAVVLYPGCTDSPLQDASPSQVPSQQW